MINTIVQHLDNFASGFQIVHGNHDEPHIGKGWHGDKDKDKDDMVEDDYVPFPPDICMVSLSLF